MAFRDAVQDESLLSAAYAAYASSEGKVREAIAPYKPGYPLNRVEFYVIYLPALFHTDNMISRRSTLVVESNDYVYRT